MAFECPKCGTVNPASTGQPGETCPSCAVIYSKALMARANERTRQEQQQRSARSTHHAQPLLDRIVWGITAASSVLGIMQLVHTMASAESAPQQAAGAGIAIALAAVPYCFARAVTSARDPHK